MSTARYSRQTLAGWRLDSLRAARLLVVGAGALGNEVLKNLALAGIGHITILDMDRVELSNLSRSVLFRDEDLGRFKAEAAVERLRKLSPDLQAEALVANVCTEIGAGLLRGFDLVLGCADSIEARLGINRLCRAAGVPWLEGGMDARGGQVSFFHPGEGACYECGMSASMWRRVNHRRGCLRNGSGAVAEASPMAATITMAAAIGALQAQEAVRLLLAGNGAPAPLLPGQKLCFNTDPYSIVVLQGTQNPACAVHAENAAPVTPIPCDPVRTSAERLMEAHQLDRIALWWDVVMELRCVDCSSETVALPEFTLTRERLACPACGRVRLPEMQTVVERGSALAQHTLATLGVPRRAILHAQRGGDWCRIELLQPASPHHSPATREEATA